MKTLINKATSTVSGVVLFAIGCVMAGIGLAAMSFLALFALSAVGLALLASPLIAIAQTGATDADDAEDTASAS
jgi:hypothetical protein